MIEFKLLFDFLQVYFAAYYILAVLFATEVVKIYMPWFKNINNRWSLLFVSTFMMVVFYLIENRQHDPTYSIRIFVSFLGIIATYELFMKKFIEFVKRKITQFVDKFIQINEK